MDFDGNVEMFPQTCNLTINPTQVDGHLFVQTLQFHVYHITEMLYLFLDGSEPLVGHLFYRSEPMLEGGEAMFHHLFHRRQSLFHDRKPLVYRCESRLCVLHEADQSALS